MITKKNMSHRKMLWIALVVFSLVLMSILLLCSRETVVSIDRFLGVWETTEPKYQNRFLKITESEISFGTGDGSANIFDVDRVIKTEEADQTVYTILYRASQGTEFELAFYYSPENSGVIRLKNQPQMEWTRSKE